MRKTEITGTINLSVPVDNAEKILGKNLTEKERNAIKQHFSEQLKKGLEELEEKIEKKYQLLLLRMENEL